MKKALIIGQTNVGKSLFLVNFASFMGLNKIILKISYPDDKVLNKEMSLKFAKDYLSSKETFKTKNLQSIKFAIPVHKGKKEIEIYDSSGLVDGIYPNMKIRQSILQTLSIIETSDLILHIIDVSTFNSIKKGQIDEIDKQLIQYGKNRQGYVLLTNKMDLQEADIGYKYIKDNYRDVHVIPISALYKRGFDEVKSVVINSI